MSRYWNPDIQDWVDDNNNADPEQDQYQYDPVHNPGGTGVGLPLPPSPSGGDTTTSPPVDVAPAPADTPTPAPGPAPAPKTDGGGGGGSNDNVYDPWGQGFQPGTLGQWSLPDLPKFTAPDLPTLQPLDDKFSYSAYTPTTWNDVLADPTYGARRDEGIGAIQNSAAGSGLLRTGGTIRDLVNYAEDFAGRDFANVDARRMATQQLGYGEAADTFDRNLGVKKSANQSLLDLYDRALSGKQAEFAPQLVGYQTESSKRQRDAELAYQHAWDVYTDAEGQHYKNADLRLRSAALV